jgi:hypothetical protein
MELKEDKHPKLPGWATFNPIGKEDKRRDGPA